MSEQARRIDGYDALDESIICYWKAGDEWLLYLPFCGLGNLRNHQVQEHDDGTISVTPSIKVTGHNAGNPLERHGYLQHGVWTEA
jgi:hypothetical protein